MPPVIPIPDPIIALIIQVFASALLVYKLIDGAKNWIPWIRDNPGILKWLNFAGNVIVLGSACFVMGQVHDLFDALKCLGAAVMASLVAAGMYESKKASDLARAGGASALVNVKAVSETENGEPSYHVDVSTKKKP